MCGSDCSSTATERVKDSLTAQRAYYVCLGCGQTSYPLDERLGLVEGKEQGRLREKVAWLAVLAPYHQAPQVCQTLLGSERHAMTLRRVALREAEHLAASGHHQSLPPGSVASFQLRGFPLFSFSEDGVEGGGMIDFKGSHFEKEIILWGVRWYMAYPISYRQLEEMMGERGVAVDYSTLNRWVIKSAPEVEKQFRRRQRPVGRSWRLDETYIKTKGKWAYLYRAVDKEGQTH